MAIELETHFIKFNTRGRTHIVDITDNIRQIITKAGFKEGNATIFGIGSTTGISTIEFEPGLVNTDIPALYDKLAAYGPDYAHHNTWGDDNGASHVRSTLTGSSLVVPFKDGRLLTGTWQQIIFLDFDTRARNREVVVQMIGTKKQVRS
jgi:secondary thiamine-phosphate synthase enzyme